MEYIKANLPATEEAHKEGRGEGVWILVDESAKRAYDTDETGTIYRGILDNDSIYYPGLMHGEPVPVEMRGEARPVVPYKWLFDHYGEAVQ